MTGAMRKMGVYLGLVEDDAHDDVEAHDSAARTRSYDREQPEQRSAAAGRRSERYDYDDAGFGDDAAPAAPALRAADPAPRIERRPSIERDRYAAPRIDDTPPPAPAAPHRISTLHPRTYNEARTLGEQFRDGNPVIMNLSEMDDADAKRLVDFAAGLTFGLRGSIERITAKVFLLSPQKVKVTAEDKARIADGRYQARG
jgi:cell division inhibitor SepF